MVETQYRVLIVDAHPVQYAPPLYRRMAQHPGVEILVAYCSLQGAERGIDPEFGVEVAWDLPLLEGYPWVQVPNRSLRPAIGRFFGLINSGLWKLVRRDVRCRRYLHGLCMSELLDHRCRRKAARYSPIGEHGRLHFGGNEPQALEVMVKTAVPAAHLPVARYCGGTLAGDRAVR